MNLGDLVILKLALLPQPPCKVAGAFPRVDLRALRRLSKKTLGRAYAEFLDANRIVPLEPSAEVVAKSRPYALRFTATHDLHHVLTGFDTSLAGEIGVLAFNVGQGTAPGGAFVLGLARIVYSIVTPWNARRIFGNARKGLELGRAADDVLNAPLDEWFGDSLDDVRRRLHIATAASVPAAAPAGSAAARPASVLDRS